MHAQYPRLHAESSRSAGSVARDTASIGKMFSHGMGSGEVICYHLMDPSGRPEERGVWALESLGARSLPEQTPTCGRTKEILDPEIGVLLREGSER